MNKKLILYLLIVLPFLFCTGCEYELQETNYVEINKPQEFDYKVQIQAPLNEEGEYVVKYRYLKFSLNIPDNVKYVDFYLYRENDDYLYNPYRVDRTDTSIYLDWLAPGKYILRCIVPPTPTGTGSLADISGYEYFGKVAEWKVLLQQNETPNLNLRYNRIDETTFNLSWDKPDPDYGEIDSYYISDWHQVIATTNETSYNVTLLRGNSTPYFVTAYFKGGYPNPLDSYVYIDNY